MDQGLMSIHGVIMEGLDVRDDHINEDSWWGWRRRSDHGGAGGGLVALWIIYDVVLYEMLCMWTITLP